MARKKPVSLAPIQAARSVLAKFESIGYRRPVGPTPERLVHAAGGAKVDAFFGVVELPDGDKFIAVPVKFVRVKVQDSPFDRLKARQQLAPNDAALNRVLGAAGDRYRNQWARAGLEPISGMDPTKEAVSGGGAGGLFSSEAASNAFQVYSKAREAIPVYFRDPTDALVLYDRDPTDIGRRYSAYSAQKQALACALHDARRGLMHLAWHLGLLAVEVEAAAASGESVEAQNEISG